jgi:hypothetical protein
LTNVPEGVIAEPASGKLLTKFPTILQSIGFDFSEESYPSNKTGMFTPGLEFQPVSVHSPVKQLRSILKIPGDGSKQFVDPLLARACKEPGNTMHCGQAVYPLVGDTANELPKVTQRAEFQPASDLDRPKWHKTNPKSSDDDLKQKLDQSLVGGSSYSQNTLTHAIAESSILDNSCYGIHGDAQMVIDGPASIDDNAPCPEMDEGSSVDDLKPIAGRSSKRGSPLAIDDNGEMELTLTVDSTNNMPFVQSNVRFSCIDYANHLLQLSVSSDDEDPDDAFDILHLPYSGLEDSSFDEFSRLECIDQLSSDEDDILDDVSYIDDASQSSHDDSEVEINDT